MTHRINRIAGGIAFGLSLVALGTIVVGYLQPRHLETDEGTLAHIFQISVALTAPAIVLFLTTADWARPLRSLRPLVLPFIALAIAFSALYYFEHGH